MTTSAGRRPHQVQLFTAGAPAPDSDGGYVDVWNPLEPESAWVRIEPATARNVERFSANTVTGAISHVVTMPYRPDVTSKARLVFGTRTLNVVGIQNPEERNVELVLACVEELNAPPAVISDSWVQGDWLQ